MTQARHSNPCSNSRPFNFFPSFLRSSGCFVPEPYLFLSPSRLPIFLANWRFVTPFEFMCLRTLPFYVCSKSFVCHCYEKCQSTQNNSQFGTERPSWPPQIGSFLTSLPPYFSTSPFAPVSRYPSPLRVDFCCCSPYDFEFHPRLAVAPSSRFKSKVTASRSTNLHRRKSCPSR